MNNDKTISQSEKINSSEELNSYLRVTTPSMWFVLVAVLVMLVGLLIGAFTYNIDSEVYFDVKIDKGTAYLKKSEELEYKENMTFVIVTDESEKEYTEKIIHVLDDEGEDYSAIAYVTKNLADGEYSAYIVKSETPITYLFK